MTEKLAYRDLEALQDAYYAAVEFLRDYVSTGGDPNAMMGDLTNRCAAARYLIEIYLLVSGVEIKPTA